MTNLIASGAVLTLAALFGAPEPAPEKALTWAECRERYSAIANEGQPSAEEAENGWPLIAALAAEAREAEREGLPLDEEWFERAAGIVEYERFVRDVAEAPSLASSTDDLTGAGREARAVFRPLFARLSDAADRHDPEEAAALFRQLAALSRATALQPSIAALQTASSIHPAGKDLAADIARRRIPGEVAASLVKAMNGAPPMPPASRNFRGDGWLSAQAHFVPSSLHKPTLADVVVMSSLIRGTVSVNEFAARAVEVPRRDREAAGLGEEAMRAEAKRRLGDLELDEMWSSTVRRVLDNEEAFASIRGGVHTLLAIEAYRHERGRVPHTLGALVPDFLESLPRDPFAPNGDYGYSLIDPAADAHGRSFLLFSVGLDGIDNGGRSAEWGFAFGEEGAGTDAVFNDPSHGL